AGHHHRRAPGKGSIASGAASVSGRRGFPVWLLHARNDSRNRGRNETKPQSERGRNLVTHEQAHLSLLQLHANPVGHPASDPEMKEPVEKVESVDAAYEKMTERFGYDFGLRRRSFVQLLGAGLLIASQIALAQRSGGRRGGFRGGGAKTIGARIHLGAD